MRISYLALVLCAGTAFAQGFSQLATNLDGSVLYFSTPMRLKGTSQYLYPKIFAWDQSAGVHLFEQRASDLPFPFLSPFTGGSNQYFSLIAPDVSSDGSTVAVTGMRFCNIGNICVLSIEEYRSTIYAAGKPSIEVPGSATLSPNGRYVLLRSSVVPLFANAKLTLLDLQTGQQTVYEGAWQEPGGKREVANDGTVVLRTTDGFLLGQGGKSKMISDSLVSFLPSNPLINSAGTTVIYQANSHDGGPARLSSYSVATGASIDLATEIAPVADFRPSISGDGSLVAFLYGSNRQIYVIGSNGAGLRQISNFAEPVVEAVLSGDGSTAFAVTATNRIVRLDVAAAQSVDIVPATPYTNALFAFHVSRGNVTAVAGTGFASEPDNAHAPYPISLDGVEVHVGGAKVPIAGVSPTTVNFPIPWDLPNARVEVEVWASSAAASPFVAGTTVDPVSPSFNVAGTAGSPILIAVHQDFRSLVSAANPARPGEYVHVYAKDLGPVIPAPAAGVAAPLDASAQLAVPISCTLKNTDDDPNAIPIPVNMPFVGLAPGLLNVFQMDVHIPESFPAGQSRLICQIGYPSLGYMLAGLMAVQ